MATESDKMPVSLLFLLSGLVIFLALVLLDPTFHLYNDLYPLSRGGPSIEQYPRGDLALVQFIIFGRRQVL